MCGGKDIYCPHVVIFHLFAPKVYFVFLVSVGGLNAVEE